MTFSFFRTYAIFQKDLKDLSKNLFVGTSLLVPLVLAFFYSTFDEVTIDMHYMGINLTFAAVTAFLQCALLAEEKEKNTLRGLMLSPASPIEILSGKSLLSFIFTLLTVMVCAFFTNYEPKSFFIIALAIFISIIFYLALGTVLGLLTKSVMEASVAILPVMFLFGFGTLLQTLIISYPWLSFVEYLPNLQLIDLAKQVENGAGFFEVWKNLAVILVWGIVACISVASVYKKGSMDS